MYHVKRTKQSPPGNEPAGPPAVHWAAGVAPRGNVTAWAGDRAGAAEVGPEQAERVKAHYSGREGAGRVELVPARAEPRKGRGREADPAGVEG